MATCLCPVHRRCDNSAKNDDDDLCSVCIKDGCTPPVDHTAALEVATKALETTAERGVLLEWGSNSAASRASEWKCHACQGKYINVSSGDRCMNDHCTSVIASRALATIRGMAGAATDGGSR